MFTRSGVLPAIFHFETGALGDERIHACLDLLADLGYRVVTVGLDTVAYRQAEPSEAAGRLSTHFGYPTEFPTTGAQP
jgi:hypothetical protein